MQLKTAAWGAYFVCATWRPACHSPPPPLVFRCHNHQERRRRIIEVQGAGPKKHWASGTKRRSREFCVILTDFLLCWQCKQSNLAPSTIRLSAFICSAQSWRFCLIRVTQLTNALATQPDLPLPIAHFPPTPTVVLPLPTPGQPSPRFPLSFHSVGVTLLRIMQNTEAGKRERNTKQIEERNCQMRFNVLLKWLSSPVFHRAEWILIINFRVTTEQKLQQLTCNFPEFTAAWNFGNSAPNAE